tara:strand:+ start:2501 stop:2848 length:348 start_codon:yes stop_codon:yes gene_type:complete
VLKEKEYEFVYRFEKDVFPEIISIGRCLNSRNCKATNVDLADGWCVTCWDKSDEAKISIQATTKREWDRKEERVSQKEMKAGRDTRVSMLQMDRVKGAGRHGKKCVCPIHISKGF